MRRIDAHIHFRPENEHFSALAAACGHTNDERGVYGSFQGLGIERAIVMGNRDLSLESHAYPEWLRYMIGLHQQSLAPESVRDSVDLVEKHLRRPDCAGIKIYAGYSRLDLVDRAYLPFYELAQSYGKPVAVHTGATASANALLKYSHPLQLDEAAVLYPGINFVMCHFGNPFLCEAAAVVEKNSNVYADLSGLLVGPLDVDAYMKDLGDYFNHLSMWIAYVENYEKFMYGTDWPLVNMREYAAFIERAIPEKHHEAVFFDNANRVYKLGL